MTEQGKKWLIWGGVGLGALLLILYLRAKNAQAQAAGAPAIDNVGGVGGISFGGNAPLLTDSTMGLPLIQPVTSPTQPVSGATGTTPTTTTTTTSGGYNFLANPTLLRPLESASPAYHPSLNIYPRTSAP